VVQMFKDLKIDDGIVEIKSLYICVHLHIISVFVLYPHDYIWFALLN
jgi:hypothetical protein